MLAGGFDPLDARLAVLKKCHLLELIATGRVKLYICDRGKLAQLSKSQAVARGALLGVQTTMW